MAVLFRADGTHEGVVPKGEDETYFTLEEAQEYVGGYIETVEHIRGDHEFILVVNEEARMMDLPGNSFGTLLTGIPIRGDILLCLRGEIR